MKCVYSCGRPEPQQQQRQEDGGLLTVKSDPDLRVVVPVGDLPDIKGLGGRVGQQAEEQDDGVGRGEAFRVDLPGKRQEHNARGPESRLGFAPAPELPGEPAEAAGSERFHMCVYSVAAAICIITQLKASFWASNPLLSGNPLLQLSYPLS